MAFVLAVGGGSTVWLWPVRPTWRSERTSTANSSEIRPLGITREGQLVTAETVESAPSAELNHYTMTLRLRMWDLATGQLLEEHPLGFDADQSDRSGLLFYSIHDTAEFANEGNSVLWFTKDYLTWSPANVLLEIDWRKGQLRRPAIAVSSPISAPTSPNGRYRFVHGPHYMPATIIDLQTGATTLDSLFSQGVFSPQSDVWAAFDDHDDEIGEIVFQSLVDGQELGRTAFPAHLPDEGDRIWAGHDLVYWQGTRIGLERRSVDPGELWLYQVWSLAVSPEFQLSDPRREPALTRMMKQPGPYITSSTRWETGTDWIAHTTYRVSRLQTVADALNSVVSNLPGRPQNLFWHPGAQTVWQKVSPETGQPLHRPIHIHGEWHVVSPDGQWLVSGGVQLEAYHLPPNSRWPWVIVAIGLPIVVKAISRRNSPCVRAQQSS